MGKHEWNFEDSMDGYDWIWEKPDWTNFDVNHKKLEHYQTQFDFNIQNTLCGVVKCPKPKQEEFLEAFQIHVTGIEAYYSNKIEGDSIHIDSLIEGVRYEFSRVNKRESPHTTISKVMADVFMHHDQPITAERLHQWNSYLVSGEENVLSHGAYRTSKEIMATRSGVAGNMKDDFIAPPSSDVPELMDGFLKWYDETAPTGNKPLPPLIRAGLAHLYFVTIHPYEDGNGRASRAIAEKALAEHINKPTLISLSHAISNSKYEYYEKLQGAQKFGHVQEWLDYFCETVIEAQKLTREKLQQAIIRKELEDNVMPQLTGSQAKAIEKMVTSLADDQRPEKGITVKQYKKMSGQKNDDLAKNEIADLMNLGVFTFKESNQRWELNTGGIYDTGNASLKMGKHSKGKRYKLKSG